MAAVVTVVVLGAGALRARGATSAAASPALTTTTSTRVPTVVSTTTVTQRRAAPSTPPRTSTTTTTTVATVRAEPHPSREACLALAAANHYQVVAANDAWLRRRLHDLAARQLLAGPQAEALEIEEAQAQTEIDAQYAIDRSNCYLK